PDFLREFEGYDVYQAYYRRCDEQAGISGWEPARRITYLWLHSLFVNYHLAADRLDMAHGVEVRLPFLDHVLFEYAHLLPLSILATPDREKVILREAVQPYISDAVYRRTKKPFWAPPAAAQGANPLRDLVQDTLRGSDMASVPFFDHAAVVRLLDRRPAGPHRRRLVAPGADVGLHAAGVLPALTVLRWGAEADLGFYRRSITGDKVRADYPANVRTCGRCLFSDRDRHLGHLGMSRALR
ncbi:MAG: asparagine synthase-related protein, partial [Myxococcota bacterium]